MAKKNPTLYSVSKTFMWFAIVSLVLTASLAGIVYTDYHREWKEYQKKFIALKADMAKKELKDADAKIDKKNLTELESQLKTADSAFKTHQAEYGAAKKTVDVLDLEIRKATGNYQTLKQYDDSYRYFFEEYRRQNDKRAARYENRLAVLKPKLAKAKLDLEVLEKSKEEKAAVLEKFVAREKELQKSIDKALEEKKRVERRLKKLEPSLATEILNAPMVDFIAPSLRIQQVVVEDLYDDYHFAKTQKVDRCTTCHLGIDQKGFENAPQPFRTHPKLELFLSSSSPHAGEKFGCTVCHGGNGHSVSFKDSAHMPRDEAQAKTWEKKYHWEMLEKWDAKMLPMNHIESSCVKCHRVAVEVPQADKLNKGRRLAEINGCTGCHKIKGMENRWKVGPGLENIASKTDKDWMAKWLQDPKTFRPSTKMPRIFNLSNTSSPEDKARNDAAIHAIVTYLVNNSASESLLKPPVPGDKERGEKLVKEIGCLGCHSIGDTKVGEYAPELTGLGSKTTPEWLYTWIKDPKRLNPNTRMPNLRLSDQEASDITSYLSSFKNASFESQSAPQVKPEVVDELGLAFLQQTMRKSEAEAALVKMSAEEKLEFVGKKSIAYQGCYACHTIKGFEDSKPIGTELSDEGRKNLHQFDFGFTNIGHTRHEWVHQKLKEPRIFDQGKVKGYYEKLRMPQFNFTDEEIDSLVTFVLSNSQEEIPLEMQKMLDLHEKDVEKGRLLVRKLNCTGCHQLDGQKGALREFTEDKGQAPPILDGEGAKVQEKWLHEFLANPSTIRPWLKTHMPTFALSDEDLKTLVEYFSALAHQEVSYKGYEVPAVPADRLRNGKDLFEKLQCVKCHQLNSTTAAMGSSFLAPDLKIARQRLKPDWVANWIKDPQVLQEGTMMPGFFPDGQSPLPDIFEGDASKQIDAIRDYLYSDQGFNAEDNKAPVSAAPIAKADKSE